MAYLHPYFAHKGDNLVSKQLRILIVDDNQMMTKTLRDIFELKGYQVKVAYSGLEGLEMATRDSFDCILSDVKMPDLTGVDLYRAIKTEYPQLPFVLMTAYATDNLIEEGLKEGVVSVLSKPLNLGLVFDFLTKLGQQRSVVVVDDDPAMCRMLEDMLPSEAFVVHPLTEAQGVLNQLKVEGEIVLLDMKLADGNGLDVFRQIRRRYPQMPVILMTGYPEEMDSAVDAALKTGAYTCLYKPFTIEELLGVLIDIHHQELGRVLRRPIGY